MNPYKKQFIDVFNSISYRHNRATLFSDFVTCSAISIHNAVCKDADLEQLYLTIIRKYDKSELEIICQLLGITVNGLGVGYSDFLGDIFMELQISSDRAGQFFTPFPIGQLMAAISFGEGEAAKENPFITVQDPACGAGGMIIAFAEAMLNNGFNPQQKMWVTAIDIDSTCAMMTYLQLALFHIPGEVICGNALTLETFRVMKTPAHYIGLWKWKLNRNLCNIFDEQNEIAPKRPTEFTLPANQIALFQ